MGSFDVSQYTTLISQALTPTSIMEWAYIIIAILAPILVIQFGLQLGGYIINKLSRAFSGLR